MCWVVADLVQTLWEVGLQMFRARITTRSDGQVIDTFWVCDESRQLPEAHRYTPNVAACHALSLLMLLLACWPVPIDLALCSQ